MNCTVCGSELERSKINLYEDTASGMVEYAAACYKCPSCGEVEYTSEDLDEIDDYFGQFKD